MKDSPKKIAKILEVFVDREDFKNLEAEVADVKLLEKRIKKLESKAPTQVTINVNDIVKDHTFEEVLHFQTPYLVQLLSLNQSVLLSGPAGCGKTQAAEHAATAMKQPFYAISVGMQTSKSDLFGFISATGKYVPSLFRKAYEKGGVFLVDEIDAGNANVLLLLNSSLSNGYTAFPDKMVKRHPDFRIVASANTIGIGGNSQYVGRNQLDAATLDRFVIMKFQYDEALEKKLVLDEKWLKFCVEMRAKIHNLGVQHFVSTRSMVSGDVMIRSGIELEAVKRILIWNKMNESDIKRLKY